MPRLICSRGARVEASGKGIEQADLNATRREEEEEYVGRDDKIDDVNPIRAQLPAFLMCRLSSRMPPSSPYEVRDPPPPPPSIHTLCLHLYFAISHLFSITPSSFSSPLLLLLSPISTNLESIQHSHIFLRRAWNCRLISLPHLSLVPLIDSSLSLSLPLASSPSNQW